MIVRIVPVLVILLSFIPFEAPLLTFSSVGSSLRYVSTKEKIYRQIDTDGGAFLICKYDNNSTLRSILKKNDGWSVVDRKNGKKGFMNIKGHKDLSVELSPQTNIFGNMLTLYNKKFDKTILYGSFIFKNKKGNEDSSAVIIKNSQEKTFVTLRNEADKKVGVVLYEGYIIINGEIEDFYTITINGKMLELCYQQ